MVKLMLVYEKIAENPRAFLSAIAKKMEISDSFPLSDVRRWDVKYNKYFDYPMKYYCEDIF